MGKKKQGTTSQDVLISMLDDVLHKLEDRVDALEGIVGELQQRVTMLAGTVIRSGQPNPPTYWWTNPGYGTGGNPYAGQAHPAQATFGMAESGPRIPNPGGEDATVVRLETPLTRSMNSHPSTAPSACPQCKSTLRGVMFCQDPQCPGRMSS